MLWPFWIVSKLMTRLGLIVAAGVAGFGAGLLMQAQAEHRTWAVVPADQERELPGDDLIPLADMVETRTLRVEAPPEAVWPWLVQMGFGRGGWYTSERFDRIVWRLENPSSDVILDEWQDLGVGDIVPDGPDHAAYFHVVSVEEQRHVVYLSLIHI